jgi:hypothetical protein
MTWQRPKQSELAKITRLEKIVEDFAIDNAALRARVAELEGKQQECWVPLKSADRGEYTYNSVRRWAADGVIKKKHVGGRIFVEANNLAEFLAMRSSATRR